ncbi:MAG: elongation factor P maturation arginine rhamnosyltransferase EarP [Treponema sp.]|nr:elongation factor P maturation arginine rhamnosyltransferase EarP [Treponema sp.]
MEVTVLCKVVDNFGDIGVVYRMCRRFLEIDSACCINLIVDDLTSFSRICDSVEPGLDFQVVEGINVWRWDAESRCHNDFIQNDGEKLSVILECFQCGRPDWMEKILFEEKLNRTVYILMIDYLTAEKYAEDFHCLQSLTRSAKVQKINFMPGFTEKTGGLIIDDEWKELDKNCGRGVDDISGGILVFTYEQKMKSLVRALKKYCSVCSESGNGGKKVLLAQGRGNNAFLEAWRSNDVVRREVLNQAGETCCKNSFSCDENVISELPYLNQLEWDKMMKACSILVIRGEESMSRACLSGIPFVWHAYPQSDEYQMVKVKALLERMRRHFSEEDFAIVEKAWLCFNDAESSDEETELALTDFFAASEKLIPSFEDFALSLRKNGDLCANIMTFIQKNYIIEK